MASKRIFIAIVSIIPLTLGDDILTFEFELPSILQSLLGNILDTNQLMRSSAIHLDWDNPNKDKDNFLIKITTKGLEDLARRGEYWNPNKMSEPRPLVETGPGVIKTEMVKYPPNYLRNRIKYLLKLKEKLAKAT